MMGWMRRHGLDERFTFFVLATMVLSALGLGLLDALPWLARDRVDEAVGTLMLAIVGGRSRSSRCSLSGSCLPPSPLG